MLKQHLILEGEFNLILGIKYVLPQHMQNHSISVEEMNWGSLHSETTGSYNVMVFVSDIVAQNGISWMKRHQEQDLSHQMRVKESFFKTQIHCVSAGYAST